MRAFRIAAMVALALLAFAAAASAATPVREFQIVIENTVNGRIFVWEDGKSVEIGKVLAPCGSVSREGFTASSWAPDSSVCATAVNAIHLKIANNLETARGILITLQPREFLDFDPANYGSYFSQSSSIFTDIPAGSGIFGGMYAPLVGSKLEVAHTLPAKLREVVEYGVLTQEFGKDGSSLPQALPADYMPSEGDAFIITVTRQADIDYVEFDNSFGGYITVKRIGQEPEVIGQVLKPVAGVGRFGGTVYARVGRIRANHPGVIDISTSPMGEIGGFQIIPRKHAMSPEMTFARTLTQWVVVGPIDGRNPSWEGLPPLFCAHLYPSYLPLLDSEPGMDEVSALNRLLSRFYVVGRMRGSEEWGPLPSVTGRVDDALVDLGAIRIYFPLPAD